MPAHKKDPTVRRRRNKAATRATLLRSTEADSAAEDYASLTVAQLRAEIDHRNSDGRPSAAVLSKRGAKAALVAALVEDDSPIPAMPPAPQPAGVWHPMTVEWWRDIWLSPMSKEWDDSDIHNLYVLATLYDDIWQAPTATARKEAAGEYRLQRKDLGLTPYDRRRLEWTIESADEAKARGEQRRGGTRPDGRSSAAAAARAKKPDPRALHAVN